MDVAEILPFSPRVYDVFVIIVLDIEFPYLSAMTYGITSADLPDHVVCHY